MALPRSLWLALGFLTTLPVPDVGEVRPGEMRAASAFYPLAGWVVGAVLAGVAWAAGGLPEGVAAAFVLAAWLAVTGMLHLDGLLDSADALLAPRPPAERLRILGDVHHGSFAFGVGFAFLLLKWQGVAALEGFLPLLAAPAAARFWLLPVLNAFPTARPEGLGATARQGNWRPALLWAAPALALFPFAFLAAGLAVFALARWAAGRLGGGLSGDVYGALVELGELAFLLAALVRAGAAAPVS